jgi:OOP family OmpA-OmpF porin
VDPQANLVLEPTSTPGAGNWNIGAWLTYSSDPVAQHHAVSHLLGGDFVANIGVTDRAAIGFDLPYVLWQDGQGSQPPEVVSAGKVSSSAIGDACVVGKVTIVSNDRKGFSIGPALATLASVSVPTGDRRSFLGDGALTASLGLLAEYAVGAGAMRASVAYDLRPDWRTWAGAGAGVTFGDSIDWALAATVEPKALAAAIDPGARQVWELGAHGMLPARPVAPFGLGAPGASDLSPVLLGLGDRIAIGHYRDTYALVGGELGLTGAVGTPTARVLVSIGWAPRQHDRDRDGVPDDLDQCPDLAEDKDGLQDDDGCPEDDADGDGILDDEDACPLVAGAASADPRRNGCPAVDGSGAVMTRPTLREQGGGK